MKSIAKKGLALLSAATLLICCGCKASKKQTAKELTGEFNSFKSGVVAENSKFSLMYDSSKKTVSFLEKTSNTLWSTSADEAYADEFDDGGTLLTKNPKVLSPIWVNYSDNESGSVKSAIAYSASLNKKTVNFEKTENGIEISYYFQKEGFMVPVKYELCEWGLRASVDRERIIETENKIVSVTLAPFMCGIKNNDTNSYLFFPSGSGSVIEPAKVKTENEISISEPVYGEDMTVAVLERKTETANVSLPVFGVKKGNSALLGIIENGAETAVINATVGSETYRYSSTYPEFVVRGKQDVITKYVGTNTKYKNPIYTDDIISGSFSVIFTPVSNASYYGMAETYREYLKSAYELKSESCNLLNLEIVGGIVTKQYILGIPRNKVLPTATLKQAESIINETADATGTKLNACLMGYGNDAYSIGKLAGGFSVSKSLGNKKQLKALVENENSNLYFNFDILRFSKGSNGFNTMFDSAKGANGYRNSVYNLQKNFRTNNISDGAYYFISRTQLDKVNKKLNKSVSDFGLGGVSFDTLSNCTYSDYGDSAYYAKSNSDSQFSEIISSYKKSGKNIATHNANIFAAVLSDHIYDTPTKSSGYQVFSYDVPFYEIVLKGYTSMSGEPVNLSDDCKKSVLRAAETGIGLTYTVIKDYSPDLIVSSEPVFYNSAFDYIKQDMFDTVASYKKYFEKVSGAEVNGHTVAEDGLRIVSFNTGIQAYVNYTDKDLSYGDIVVKANSFEWRE